MLCLLSSARAGTSKPGFTIYTPRAPQPTATVQAPKSGTGAQAAPTGDGTLEDLERARAAQQKAYQELNEANPFAQHPGLPSGALPTAPPKTQLGQLLANSWLQKYLRFLAREDFQRLVQRLVDHPHRNWLFIGQALWLIVFLALRAWRLSKVAVTQWARVLWITLWSFIVYAAGVTIGVPWLVFGDLWAQVLKLVLE